RKAPREPYCCQGRLMNPKAVACALFFLAFLDIQAGRAEPRMALLPPIEASQDTGGKSQPQPSDQEKKTPGPKLTEGPKTDLFAEALAPSRETSTGFNPHMM